MNIFRKSRKLELPARIIGALEINFSEHEMRMLSRLSTFVELNEGSPLTREGQPGNEALVLVSGTADVVRDDEVIAQLTAGDIIGEMALLAGAPRSATVVTTSSVSALVMTPREFNSLLAACPRLASSVQKTAVVRAAA